MRRLPPLTAVEAFVRVARLGSVKAAAADLALSSPALSRRLQTLERFVGMPLFERRHQALVLNAAGDALLARLGPALDQLADAIQGTGQADDMRLQLGVLPLYGSQRLMPHLGQLRAAYPELHIDVDTGGQALARLGEELDVAIVLASSIDPALYARSLGKEMVVALGAKSIYGDDPEVGRALIERSTILLHRDMPGTYAEWMAAMDLPDAEPEAIDHFDSGPLMLEAAAQGLGIAFMLAGHYAAAHDDRLVALSTRPVQSDLSYWFACRPAALKRRPVRLFHDWLAGLPQG